METNQDLSQTNDSSDHACNHAATKTLETVADGLESVAGYISSSAEAVRRRMVEFRDHGFDGIKDDVVKYTRDQPTNALLIAAGLGALVGILSALRRR